MEQIKTFRIIVRAATGAILNYSHVKEYTVDENGFLRFTDSKTGDVLLFPMVNCQLQEEQR